KTMLTAEQIEKDLATLREIVLELRSPDSPLGVTQAIIDGREQTVFANVPANLRQVYQLGLNAADKDFLIYEDERYTFRQSLETAEVSSLVLVNRYGIKKGERVSISFLIYA